VTSKCNADSELYLKYEHFGTNIDIFLIKSLNQMNHLISLAMLLEHEGVKEFSECLFYLSTKPLDMQMDLS